MHSKYNNVTFGLNSWYFECSCPLAVWTLRLSATGVHGLPIYVLCVSCWVFWHFGFYVPAVGVGMPLLPLLSSTMIYSNVTGLLVYVHTNTHKIPDSCRSFHYSCSIYWFFFFFVFLLCISSPPATHVRYGNLSQPNKIEVSQQRSLINSSWQIRLAQQYTAYHAARQDSTFFWDGNYFYMILYNCMHCSFSSHESISINVPWGKAITFYNESQTMFLCIFKPRL